MNLEFGHSTAAAVGNGFSKHLVSTIGGIAVSVVVLAAIGAWQASARLSTGGVEHASTGAVQQATSPATAAFALGGHSVIYYLVGSQEQASRVENEFREGASALANGEPVLPRHEIVAVSTAEDEALLRQAVTDMTADANAAGIGWPQLIDLRPH